MKLFAFFMAVAAASPAHHEEVNERLKLIYLSIENIHPKFEELFFLSHF